MSRRFLLSFVTAIALAGQAAAAESITVGLITKTESNPFFVKMKEGAAAEAKKQGAKLLTGAGAKDGDNEGQVTALENMVNAGAKGILITPKSRIVAMSSVSQGVGLASCLPKTAWPPTSPPPRPRSSAPSCSPAPAPRTATTRAR